jgi:hypothetical protein
MNVKALGIFILMPMLLLGLSAQAASLCAKVHPRASTVSILIDSENALSESEKLSLTSNLGKFSGWLGEAQIYESMSALKITTTVRGAQFVHKDRSLQANPNIFGNAQNRQMKSFAVVIFHEYTHAHLEIFLGKSVLGYKEFQKPSPENILKKRRFEMLSGVHELVADMLPSLALKEPNILEATLTGLDFSSKHYSRETTEKIRASRKFQDNKFTDAAIWKYEMERIEWLDGEWDAHMMFAFVRPKIWSRALVLSQEKGTVEAQAYVKRIARRLVDEIINGKLNSPYMTLDTLKQIVDPIVDGIQ